MRIIIHIDLKFITFIWNKIWYICITDRQRHILQWVVTGTWPDHKTQASLTICKIWIENVTNFFFFRFIKAQLGFSYNRLTKIMERVTPLLLQWIQQNTVLSSMFYVMQSILLLMNDHVKITKLLQNKHPVLWCGQQVRYDQGPVSNITK